MKGNITQEQPMEEMQRAKYGEECGASVFSGSASLSPNLHVLTNPEALRNLSFGVSIEASRHRLSSVRLFVIPWTVAHQAPISMGIFQARILEWVAMPSSRGSSWPRDGTQVSHIAGRFFTVWATRELGILDISILNTEEGSLSLLHRIFLTQGSNQNLQHCWQILY